MRSGAATVLVSFGTIFLSFGGVILLLGMLGLHFGSRETLGSAGTSGAVFLLLGAVMLLVGMLGGKRNRESEPAG